MVAAWHVRIAEVGDVPGIRTVAERCGQGDEGAGGDARYVEHLMTWGRFVVADGEQGIIGYAATRALGEADFLCDLFVDPEHEGRGVGSAMLAAAWSGAPDRFTFSSAHPAAVPLYVRAGMRPWWTLYYLAGDPKDLPMPDPRLAVTEVTPQAAAEVEQSWNGVDRTPDYQYWVSRPQGRVVVVTDPTGPVAVAAVGGAGDDYGVSHLTAAAPVAGPLLAVLATLDGPAQVKVPGPHPALAYLFESGWRIGYTDVFMATDEQLLRAQLVCPHAGLA